MNSHAIPPDYSLAKLIDYDGVISERWYVRYSYRNPNTGKLVRIKVYEDLNQHKTLEDKRKAGKNLVQKVNRKLTNGLNPFSDKSAPTQDIIIKTDDKNLSQIQQPQLTIGQHLKTVLTSNSESLRKKSFQTYDSKVKIFTAWLVLKSLDEIPIRTFTNDQAKEFLRYLTEECEDGPTTRNSYLQTLKSQFSQLLEEKIISENPFQKIKKLPSQKTSKRHFIPEQRGRLTANIKSNDSRLWLFIQFMHYCFIRPKELRQLQIADLDLYGAKIRIRGEISKNKKTEFVRIPDSFMRILEKEKFDQYPFHFFLFGKKGLPGLKKCGENFFYDHNDKVLKLLGFKNEYSLYSWRHTAAIMYYEATKDLKGLQSQMRHSSLEITNEYLKNFGVMDNDNLKSNFPEL